MTFTVQAKDREVLSYDFMGLLLQVVNANHETGELIVRTVDEKILETYLHHNYYLVKEKPKDEQI